MTIARSNTAQVRNPVASDPEVAAIIETLTRDHPAAAAALRDCLQVLSRKWRVKAQQCWASHKAPMAAYHKANAVNARHLALAIPDVKYVAGQASYTELDVLQAHTNGYALGMRQEDRPGRVRESVLESV